MAASSSKTRGSAGDGRPMSFRPMLARAVGLEEAIVLEEAMRLQASRGREFPKLGLRCFYWPPYAQRQAMAWLKERSQRRLFARLTGRRDAGSDVGAACAAATATDDAAESVQEESVTPPAAERSGAMLWQFSLRGADQRLSRDWFSVNLPAVRRACPTSLFDLTPAGGGQDDRSDPPVERSNPPGGAADLTGGSGQIGRKTGVFDRSSREFGFIGAADSDLRSSLTSVRSGPNARGGGQSDRPAENQEEESGKGEEARAAAALAAMGADGIPQLLACRPDAASRCLVAISNYRRLRAAGFAFDRPQKNWVIGCVKRGVVSRHLSDVEISQKVRQQQAQQCARLASGGGDRELAAEIARQDAELTRMPPVQWDQLMDQAAAAWASAGRRGAFPRGRSAPVALAAARATVFGPQRQPSNAGQQRPQDASS